MKERKTQGRYEKNIKQKSIRDLEIKYSDVISIGIILNLKHKLQYILQYSLLHFWIMHVYDGICRIPLSLLEMAGPHIVHPVNKVHLDNKKKKKKK